MNYDHLNTIHNYWRKKVFPNLVHSLTVSSFDDYLKKFSWLPSGKWLRDFDGVKLSRVPFAIDPEKFTKAYKDNCVSYNAPSRPEDGFQRVIYQFSPTLHAEVAFWTWVENDELQAYGMMFLCYRNEEEMLNFVDAIYKLRREGNTETDRKEGGFAAFIPKPGTRK